MNIDRKFEQNIDEVASVVHDVWSHWQIYLHSQCEKQSDGSLLIPKELVEQWERKMHLKYEELTRSEQKSDIEQAQKYKDVLKELMQTK